MQKRPTKPKPAPTDDHHGTTPSSRRPVMRSGGSRTRNLSPQEVRECLNLLRIGQDLVMRLQGYGVQLPEIDLSYSPPVHRGGERPTSMAGRRPL